MDNLNALVDDLLNRREEKINNEKNLERIKYETIRENLINLFIQLQPLKEPMEKLASLYRGEPHMILGYDVCKNRLSVTYSLKYKDFVLEKLSLGNWHYYTLNELKHNPFDSFKKWVENYNLKISDYSKTINFMNEKLNEYIERLKREVK